MCFCSVRVLNNTRGFERIRVLRRDDVSARRWQRGWLYIRVLALAVVGVVYALEAGGSAAVHFSQK